MQQLSVIYFFRTIYVRYDNEYLLCKKTMTWAVGGLHIGCARCISDIQITLKYSNGNKQYIDAVQKIHIIGPGIALAFSGSIKLAFTILNSLKNVTYKQIDNRLYAQPYLVAQKFKKAIKYYYKKHKTVDNCDVEFLIFIAPTGLFTSFGAYKLKSPDFDLVSPTKPFELMHIGSGSINNDYIEISSKFEKLGDLIQKENGKKPDLVVYMGKTALQYVFAHATEYQNAGISNSMHICFITHDNINIKGLPSDPFSSFPEVAKSWEELEKIFNRKGIKMAGCCAIG